MKAAGMTRSWPGSQAFSEPGTAPSVDYLMNGVVPFGVGF